MKIKIAVLIFLMFAAVIGAQQKADALKKAAIEHMNAGRYGEAIKLLNKYISALPRRSDGYNLRGLCYEARTEYKNAVIDFRRALKLDPKNKEIRKNLNRVTAVWYKILKKNIVGYKRGIQIDPGNPYNYLEIGKAYGWMEEWNLAEKWYDEYLKRDPNASPDEIIRYTEILTMTKHILKGWKILKKWVEKHPDDWRLWSRYGYFSLWLGKYKLAKKAFERALSFKPFFQEAQNGLDIAMRHAYVTELGPSEVRGYPIDRYYRILKRNPNNDRVRFLLVDALISAKRIEEAYQQLLQLSSKYQGTPKFEKKWNYVVKVREKLYKNKIASYQKKLSKNPRDKKATYELAKYLTYVENYDSALAVYEAYLKLVPDEKDPEFLYDYARVASWSREFDKAIAIMDKLLERFPNNIKYQLFRAQLSIWTNQDLDLAGQYLTNVLKKEPKNVDALIAMGSYLLAKRDFAGATEMADRAAKIDASNPEIEKLRSNIEFQKMRAHEEKLYSILEVGRRLAMKDSCKEALPYYQQYLNEAEPNDLILKEYGDVQFCAKNYDEARKAYDEVLSHGYMYQAALQRAKVDYARGDSLTALKEFKKLTRLEPQEFDPILYLADTYAKIGKADSARAIYNLLLDKWDLDSTETEMVKLRLGWLPVTGIAGLIATFPSSVGIAPIASYYADNLGFRFYRVGGRLDLGLISYFSLGVSLIRTYVRADGALLQPNVVNNLPNGFTGIGNFTSFKGHLFANFNRNISAGIAYGSVTTNLNNRFYEAEAFARYEKKDTFSVVFNYTKTDADIILYSPYLIDVRYQASLSRLSAYYYFGRGLMVSGYFDYITVTDQNAGNNLQIRLGREFWPDVYLGYEYYYSVFKFENPLYYSPTGFESHSLWINAFVIKNKNMRFTLFGKIGYVPASRYVLKEGRAQFEYEITRRLSLNASIGAGSTTRDNSSYRYSSAELSIYWSVY